MAQLKCLDGLNTLQKLVLFLYRFEEKIRKTDRKGICLCPLRAVNPDYFETGTLGVLSFLCCIHKSRYLILATKHHVFCLNVLIIDVL